MKNKNVLIILALAIVVLGYWFLSRQNFPVDSPANPLNATYIIEGASVSLVNGHAETEIVPGSASKLITDVWGEPSAGDLNGDGVNDSAVLLTQSGGGSGTFYYVAADLGNGSGTNALLLGDRIAPQNIQVISPGLILVNYADRKPGEAMTVQPSEGISAYFRVQGTTLEKTDAPQINQ